MVHHAAADDDIKAGRFERQCEKITANQDGVLHECLIPESLSLLQLFQRQIHAHHGSFLAAKGQYAGNLPGARANVDHACIVGDDCIQGPDKGIREPLVEQRDCVVAVGITGERPLAIEAFYLAAANMNRLLVDRLDDAAAPGSLPIAVRAFELRRHVGRATRTRH